jgi:hypothetical protein
MTEEFLKKYVGYFLLLRLFLREHFVGMLQPPHPQRREQGQTREGPTCKI